MERIPTNLLQPRLAAVPRFDNWRQMCFPPICHPATHVLGCFGLRQGAGGVLVLNALYGLALVIVHALLLGEIDKGLPTLPSSVKNEGVGWWETLAFQIFIALTVAALGASGALPPLPRTLGSLLEPALGVLKAAEEATKSALLMSKLVTSGNLDVPSDWAVWSALAPSGTPGQDEVCVDVIISGPWMLAVDPQMLWGTDEELFEMSSPVEEFDFFISHTWRQTVVYEIIVIAA
ncbi:hypothetical protein AK812_SmicGene9481 [Symbiodinium microadriaticum]|uniref:Uncharacterized protein n=1 Tax=Symbiodinium microadriaticum TaxID=2951 RepID=A0A1Q9EID1_SYMMI|nr:hypothetical protein AK812_SmicGene9481 [Symbiodinium microadriaticum]